MREEPQNPQINMAKIPVDGNVAGAIFALGAWRSVLPVFRCWDIYCWPPSSWAAAFRLCCAYSRMTLPAHPGFGPG